MIPLRRRRAAIETLWAAMLEGSEITNDLIVSAQRNADATAARKIERGASTVQVLARAIVILTGDVEDAT